MTPEQWQNIKRVLAGALEKSPEDRRTYLDETCPDPDLRREVESLIAAHEQGSSDFMEPPTKASPLQPGTRLGPYEIVSRIGRGGMGVVYRAHDSKLRRDVAIKVLPPAFVNAPDRLARFQREARLLASLNHPNIAAIHGLEDSGGTHALVMELVEGPTLGDRIAHGPIPIDEALPIAKQIAEGLEYAHEHGIVHRDLKPANIKVTADGTVKILDFGLAKAMETGLSPDDMGDSPTLSRMATEEGVLLGTAAYMSPEQAKAKPVDRRADVWAFGCVLFEMLAGELAFPGESVTETLAAVLKNEPDWSQLPKGTPPHLRVLLYRCLQKDPKQRLRDIGDARLALDELLSGVAPQIAQIAPAELPPIWRRPLPWAVSTVVLAFVAALFGYLYSVNRSPAAPQVTLAEFTIPPPTQTGFNSGLMGASPALSPDGKQLLFLAPGPGPGAVTYLWLRSLGSMTARRLDATENATAPFWSPDGKSIGFGQNGQLVKMSLSGGKPIPLAGVPILRGASWSPEGVIIFSPDPDFGLFRVSASGGKATPASRITSRTGNSDMWPWFLPDGRHFLYAELWDGSNKTTIYLGTLDALDAKVVVPQANSNAIYASGNILYMEGKALLARPFDPKRLVTTGPATTVAPSVANYGLAGLGAFTASVNGTLVYQPGVADAESLSWFDRSGKLLSTLISSPSLQYSELSPDGRRLAVELNGDIWIYGLEKGTPSQFTFDGKTNALVWSPDGKQIVFGSGRGSGHYDLYIKPADGSAQAKVLYADPMNKYPTGWTPDGKYLLYFGSSPDLINVPINTFVLPLEGAGKPRLLAKSRIFGRISPDGHWVVYNSMDWGGYLTSFPVPGGPYRIPGGPALLPRWSADGSRIYYVTPAGTLMQVSVRTHGSAAEIGTPQKLFGGIMSLAGDPFAVAPGGERILAITSGPGLATHPLTLVQNWPAKLQK